jgi:RNA polymerase sigma-70 factor (ECF subfamily)
MAEPPVTRPSLLIRIRDQGDQEAWRQFVDLYAPLIYGLARRRGLQDADAADLTQDVFRTLAQRQIDYRAERGSFRGWLYTVARNRINDFLDGRRRREQGSGDTSAMQALNEQPARDDEAECWDREYEQRMFHCAAEQVRGEFAETTWQAFWRVAVEGESPEDVARALQMSVGSVYVAKSRVLTRLRREIQEIK